MPLRPVEICKKCHKHIHPQTDTSKSSHPLPECGLCLPPGNSLLFCGRCRLTRYCGKACQKDHWPTHKEVCEGKVLYPDLAKAFGPETEAKRISFARWCDDNDQAFVQAAKGALAPLDQQRAAEHVFFVAVRTRGVASDKSNNKQRFDHSIILASKQSMQTMHNTHEMPMGMFHGKMGGPVGVKSFLLPSTTSKMQVVLKNVDLPSPLDFYTLTFDIDEDILQDNYDPDWLERLEKSVK